MKNSARSGPYDNVSNNGSAHSSIKTMPVKLTGKTVLDDSSGSDMNDTDEGNKSPRKDLNVRLVQSSTRKSS